MSTMKKADDGDVCCVRSMMKINEVFENFFKKVGFCVFRFPTIVLVSTLIFFGICSIFVSQIEAADNILELILGDDSIVVKIANWRDKYLKDSTWGTCSTDEPTQAPTCMDDPAGSLSSNNYNCNDLADQYGCSMDLSSFGFVGYYLSDVCPVTCVEGCGCVDDPTGNLALLGGNCQFMASNPNYTCSHDFTYAGYPGVTLSDLCPVTCQSGCNGPTTSPTSPPSACTDDPSGMLTSSGGCAFLSVNVTCAYEFTNFPGTFLSDICPVTCASGCGARRRRRLSTEESDDCEPTGTPTELSDTSVASMGSFVFLAVDHDKENILKPEFLLEYASFLKRFMKDFTTTCDAYPNQTFGWKDVAIWEYYNADYMAAAEFPLENSGILRCFREGNWSNYDNPPGVLGVAELQRLSFYFEYAYKVSLLELLNSNMTSENKTEAIAIAIQGCWQYIAAYQAAYPIGYMLGGMVFPEYTTDDMPEIGDHVMVYIGVNDWKGGIISEIVDGFYSVVDAQSGTTTIRTNCSMSELRQTMRSAVGLQTLFSVGIPEEFAKRVQKQHYQNCETTGNLNGIYNCTGDDQFDVILADAETCHRKIIEDLSDAIRTANEEEDLLVDFAIFMPFDEENILKYATSTNSTLVIICICVMVVFVGVVAANPCQPSQSKASTGALGVILVFFSTMAGMGLCRLVFQFDFTPGSMQVLPFMGFGLGVDDMLVLLWTYNYKNSEKDRSDEICRTIKEAGLSITLTSVTNFISFFIGAFMPLKELSYFSVTAACIMFTNYIGILFGFSSILVLHNVVRAKRRESIVGNLGEGALFNDDEEATKLIGFSKVKNVSERSLKLVPALVIFGISALLFIIALFVSPQPRWGISLNDLIPDKHPMKGFFEYWEGYFNTITAHFGFGLKYENGEAALNLENHYSTKFQSLDNFYNKLDDSEYIEVVSSTWMSDFKTWVAQDTGESFANIPDEDQSSITARSFINSTGNPFNGTCNTTKYPEPYALCTLILQYDCVTDSGCAMLAGLCTGGDCTTCQGLVDQLVIGEDSYCDSTILSCPEYRFGGGTCFSGITDNFEYIGRAGVCDEPPADNTTIQTAAEGPYYTIQDGSLDKEGCMAWCDEDVECVGFIYWMWPDPEDISDVLADFSLVPNGGCRLFNNNSMANCTNVDSRLTEEEGLVSLYKAPLSDSCTQTSSWENNTEYQNRCFMELLRIWATETEARNTVAQELIWSNGNSEPGADDYLVGGESSDLISTGVLGVPLTGTVSEDAIKESRSISNEYADVGAYADGILYEYYDQLFEVGKYLFPSLCYICLSVFFCSLIFILHPIAALVMVLSLIVTLVELWGFLNWAEIKVNGVLALNMVVACGVSVEFSAHINRRFMLARGTPRERLGTALGVLFIPVTLGGATSIIAVSFMAFSDMPYTRIYYFRLFSCMIALGWWNGVFFQSVLILLVAKCFEGTCMELRTISRRQGSSTPIESTPDISKTEEVEMQTGGNVTGESELEIIR